MKRLNGAAEEIQKAAIEAEAARDWLPNGALQALIERESNWNDKGGQGNRVGLMRVGRDTLERYGVAEAEAQDWRVNMRAGLAHLDELYSELGDPILALTAYRAGIGKVGQWQRGKARLSRAEMEFAPELMARSTKYGAAASHRDLIDMARKMGVDRLDSLYHRAGITFPKLPKGADPSAIEDLADDPEVALALDDLAGQEILDERDDRGRRKRGATPAGRVAIEDVPGAPAVPGDRKSQQVPAPLALALGMQDASATLGERVDRMIASLWRTV